MPYDLKSLKVPRLAGATLRTVVRLMERNYSRQLLAPVLAKELGANLLTSADLSTEPTFLPMHQTGNYPEPSQAAATLAFFEQKNFKACNAQLPSSLDIAKAYRQGSTTPTKLAAKVIANITASQQSTIPLNAIVVHDESDISRQAKASEQRIAKGTALSILDGIPVAIKDELDAVPYATMVGTSVIGQEASAERDATVVARLRAAGAIVIGKTNMHEIGLGVSGANITYGHCHNPCNLKHYAGGSSSGSAAAVAAGICPLSLGADGGGSIRIPAALCGVTGLKPTWGRVSEYGAFPLCPTLAHIGPIGVTVDDVALAYSIIAGADPLDTRSCNQPNVHLTGYLNENLEGIKLGIYSQWFNHANREIVQQCQLAVEILKDLKATIQEIEIDELNLQRVAHAVTITSEMRAAVDKLHREQAEKFAPDTRLLLAISRLFTGKDYVKAQQIRTLTMREFERVFLSTDIIVTPATGITAPAIKKPEEDDAESNLSTTNELMRFSFSTNLAGLPALTVPVGYDEHGLPIGIQLIGKPWQEHIVLRAGRALEQRISRRQGEIGFNLLQAD